MAKITITISPNGNKTTIETEGFRGGRCLKATKGLKEKLGHVGEEELTEEYYDGDPLNETEVDHG